MKKPSLTHLITTGALALALAVTTFSLSPGAGADSDDARPGRPLQQDQWVHSWTSMPQLTEEHNMPPEPFTGQDAVLVDATLRQTIHVSTGGEEIRLRFSNAFGTTVLPITSVSVALPAGGEAGVSGIEPGSTRDVTFSGEESITVPVGAQVVSDPIDFPVEPDSNLTVTLYLADGQAGLDNTGHPGSRTTSYMLAGDHTDAEDLPGAVSAAHWYFLSGLEVMSDPGTAAVAIVGDSLTDGRGSTTDGNDRWTDQLFDRLQANEGTRDVAVLNQAAGGNRVLQHELGPNVMSRLDRDVFAHSGVRWMILFEGVNDIGTAPATQEDQEQVAADLITAYDQAITMAHAQGIEVFGATITPFGGSFYMDDDPNGYKEVARQTVNEWIRTSGRFDEVLDFDAAVRDPNNPDRLQEHLDFEEDWLHLTPEGYGLLAESVPVDLFDLAPARGNGRG